MTPTFSCPEAEFWQAVLDGMLPETGPAAVGEHLEACTRCQQVLEELAADRDSWTEAAACLRRARPAHEEALCQAVRRLKESSPPATWPQAADTTDEFLTCLDPPQEPGHLGRLGRYEITEVVGRGGMGVVLKAVDGLLHRLVAIKLMASPPAASGTARKRFLREARAAAAVSHEHVITIHAVEEVRGLPCIVMEYVDGGSLQDRLDRDGPLELKEVLRIGMQTAQGLAAAHAQGLIHRDVKPANILLESPSPQPLFPGAGEKGWGEGERVKLTDFGLARAIDDASLTQSGVVSGTPLYMAPEQARGESLDHRSDLFSLGSVLYAMCTGRPPFRADLPLAVLRRVCDETPAPIAALNPEVPGWLGAIIEKLHAKDPADRFSSAAEVAGLLGRHLAHLQQPALVPMPPPVPRPPRRRAARPWRILVAGALVLGLALAGLAALRDQFPRGGIHPEPPDADAEGVLVVRVDDPQAEVTIGAGGRKVVLSGTGDHEVRLRPGEHRVSAVRNCVPVHDRSVFVVPGETTFHTVTVEPPRPEPPDLPRSPGLLRRLPGHTGPVRTALFLPDGRRVLSGSGWPNGDRTLRLWDAESGVELRRILMPSLSREARGEGSHESWGEVHGLALSPDGRFVLAGSVGGLLILWDLETGKEVRRFNGHRQTVFSPTFSPDGRRALSGSRDHTVRLWDVARGQELRCFEGHTGWVRSVAFSPNGRRALSGGRDRTIRLWDMETGAELRCVSSDLGSVEVVAFAPDGRRALSAEGTFLRLWDVETGQEIRRFEAHRFGVNHAVFSPDGRLILSGGYDAAVRLWDPDTGELIQTFAGHHNWVWSVAFSPDGRRALSAGGGASQNGTYVSGDDFALRLWEVRDRDR